MTAKADTATAKTDYVIEPGKQELTITRVFDAPRELVFKAFTDPKLVSQWLGPRQYTTTVDKMEARPGGLWRFVQRNQNGDEFAFHGVHHDVVAPPTALTRRRGRARYENPVPVLGLPMGSRFRNSSVMAWLATQETRGA